MLIGHSFEKNKYSDKKELRVLINFKSFQILCACMRKPQILKLFLNKRYIYWFTNPIIPLSKHVTQKLSIHAQFFDPEVIMVGNKNCVIRTHKGSLG